MRVALRGHARRRGVTAKDLILGLIGQIGTAGATGHVVEYAGEAIRALSMEGRMTVCNMSIEAGARAGLIAPDDTTFAYLEGRPGRRRRRLGAGARALARAARPTSGATFDREVVVDAAALAPQVTWGTNPGQVAPVTGRVPEPTTPTTDERALRVHGPRGRHARSRTIAIDRVFIGSCTNGRIEDLRAAARGGRAASRSPTSVRAMVVPGLEAGQAAGRGGGPRPGLHRRRLRVAERRLLDVPRHEPRHPRSPASAAPRPRTATSRAARAAAAAPTSSQPGDGRRGRDRRPPRRRAGAGD